MGTSAIASSRRVVASSVHGCSPVSAGETETVTPASVFANASRIVVARRLERLANRALAPGLDRDHRGCVARDRVSALASVQRDEPEGRLRMRLAQRATEDLDRIRAAQCDARARVSALAAGDRDGQRYGLGSGILARSGDPHPRVRASGATDRQPTVLLAVEVDEDRARDELRVERIRAFEPDFLRHRHQQLERPVGQRFVLDQRHHRRDRDPVVGAEGRPVGLQPLAVANERDASLGRVVRARGVTLADHVQMALERHGGRRLAPWCRRNPDHEVSAGVLHELEAVLLDPRANVLDHRLLGARRARDLRQRLEVSPERARLEPCQHGCLGRHLGHVSSGRVRACGSR